MFVVVFAFSVSVSNAQTSSNFSLSQIINALLKANMIPAQNIDLAKSIINSGEGYYSATSTNYSIFTNQPAQIIARVVSSSVDRIVSDYANSDGAHFAYNINLTAVNGDVYIPDGINWVGSNMKRNFEFGANVVVERDGKVIDLTDYNHTENYLFSMTNVEKIGNYWVIKEGHTARLNLNLYIDNLKQSGMYRISLVGFSYKGVRDTKLKMHNIYPGVHATQNVYLKSTAGSSSVACGPYTRDLTVGSNGRDVVNLQTFLTERGFLDFSTLPNGPVAFGYFGPLTQAALAQYQILREIAPAEGYFGSTTRATVARECGNQPPVQSSIKVLSPNGGNYYPNDKSKFIVEWSTQNIPTNFKFDTIKLIKYKSNSEIVLSKNVLNDGIEEVSFKGLPAGEYILEIKGYLNGKLITDTSDTYFKIINLVDPSIKPIIKSILPNHGVSGTMVTVYGSGFTTESIVLIGDNIENLTPMDISAYGDWLTFPFPASAFEKSPNSDSFGVRISNVGNVSVDSGLSSNSVSFYPEGIQPPMQSSIKVLSPNGGETIIQSKQSPIVWSGNNLSTVFAFIVPANSPGNGVGALGTLGSVSNGNTLYWDGKTAWTDINDTDSKIIIPPGNYKIYLVGNVANQMGKTVNDMSDNYFTVVSNTNSNSITVTSPTEGTIYDDGPSEKIITKWTKYEGDFDYYRISLVGSSTRDILLSSRLNKKNTVYTINSNKVEVFMKRYWKISDLPALFKIEAIKKVKGKETVVAGGMSGSFLISDPTDQQNVSIKVEPVSVRSSYIVEDGPSNDLGIFEIKFEMTAVNGDIYVARNSDQNNLSTKNDFGVYAKGINSNPTLNVSSVLSAVGADLSEGNNAKIAEGQTATFTLTISAQNQVGQIGIYRAILEGIRYNGDDSSSVYDLYQIPQSKLSSFTTSYQDLD